MSKTSKAQEVQNSEVQKSKVITAVDEQPFNVQLTVSQANAISKLLPKGYSIHIDRTIKTKRVVKKKFTLDSKSYKNNNEASQEVQINQVAEEQQNNYGTIQTINYDEMIKKCQKILNLLRKNKNSWPFRDPVDPITMGIPQYRQIIANPMDLRTIGENLISNKYSTMAQFYADIQLIVSNSYTFNKNNPEFEGITSQFEKYFQKLKSQPVATMKSEVPLIKKVSSKPPAPIQRKDSQIKPASQFALRKQIAMKLKYLPKQEIKQLISQLNNSENNSEINLETLAIEKIRFLQSYLSKKQSMSKGKQEVKKSMEDQSSFQSDSDS